MRHYGPLFFQYKRRENLRNFGPAYIYANFGQSMQTNIILVTFLTKSIVVNQITCRCSQLACSLVLG